MYYDKHYLCPFPAFINFASNFALRKSDLIFSVIIVIWSDITKGCKQQINCVTQIFYSKQFCWIHLT